MNWSCTVECYFPDNTFFKFLTTVHVMTDSVIFSIIGSGWKVGQYQRHINVIRLNPIIFCDQSMCQADERRDPSTEWPTRWPHTQIYSRYILA